MSEHRGENSLTAGVENTTLTFPVRESNKSRFVGKLLYWWCWLVAAVLLLLIGLPTLPLFWILRKKHWLYPFALFGARTWFRACGARMSVSGMDRLDPKMSYVFVANHRSYLDTVVIFAGTGRRLGLVAKRELLKVPIIAQGMGFVNIIAIDRSNQEKALQSMEHARTLMQNGGSFGIFAEGTRAMPGELLPFKKGAFHLAIQTGASVVPVVIKDTDWMMGKKQGVCYPGTVRVVMLDPLPTAGMTVDQDLIPLLDETRNKIAQELRNNP